MRIVLIISISLIMVGCSALIEKIPFMGDEEEKEKIIISIQDEEKDIIIEPLESKIYSNSNFDMVFFEIREFKERYYFVIEIMGYFTKEKKNINNWDNQIFDIYLNLGNGLNKHTLKERNVKIKQGWDKVIILHPNLNKNNILKENEVFDSISNIEVIRSENMIIPKIEKISGNRIYFSIPKKEIDISRLEGMQVFSLGFDILSKDNFQGIIKVERKLSQFRFGGGSDFAGNPNVIDILGDNEALGNFVSEKGYTEFAEIDMIDFEY